MHIYLHSVSYNYKAKPRLKSPPCFNSFSVGCITSFVLSYLKTPSLTGQDFVDLQV